MPNAFAMAIAVALWSPVIITVLIPALLHFATASFTSSLGGSIIPTIPTYVKSLSIVFISSSVGSWSISLYAIASTRRASFAIASFCFVISCLKLSKSCFASLFIT